ncbi:MAG: alpha/beta hydrolase [Verrucomicrobia bacterium]|nr:alpha/beta hydrolase [Verrucomicrobiota bacterium]
MYTKFSRTGVPVLNVDDAGGVGLPVVFQHGLCGDARQTIEAFPRDRRFRRITIEARGHGGSEAGDPDLFSIRTFAADIAAFIEAHRLAPIVIGGISMGAASTLHLAVHRPEIVRGLILVRPAWITASAPDNNSPNREVGRLLADLSPDDAKKRFEVSETARLLAQIAPDNLASLKGFFSREPQATTAALLQSIAADGPGVTAQDLRNLETPTLIVGHEIDYIHPFSYATALSQLIPRSQLVRITPKAVSKAAYLEDLHKAITNFLETFSGARMLE